MNGFHWFKSSHALASKMHHRVPGTSKPFWFYVCFVFWVPFTAYFCVRLHFIQLICNISLVLPALLIIVYVLAVLAVKKKYRRDFPHVLVDPNGSPFCKFGLILLFVIYVQACIMSSRQRQILTDMTLFKAIDASERSFKPSTSIRASGFANKIAHARSAEELKDSFDAMLVSLAKEDALISFRADESDIARRTWLLKKAIVVRMSCIYAPS
jgi:hypothetical protein